MRSTRPLFITLLLSFATAAALSSRLAPTSAASAAPAQTSGSTPAPLAIVSRDGVRPLPVSLAGTQEFVSLGEVASIFGLDVREDTRANVLSVSRGKRSALLSLGQGLASSSGRVVSLGAPPQRAGRDWLVPIDFVERVLPLLTETRVSWRREARLLLVGDLRVPRLTVRHEATKAGQLRIVVDIVPRTDHTLEERQRQLVLSFEADAVDVVPPTVGDPGLVRAVRRVDAPPGLVFELGPRFASYRTAESPVDGNGVRLTIDFAGTPMPTEAGPGASTELPAPSPAPPLVETPSIPVRTVVIDPGHGGDETGARGPKGALEKEVALEVARKLKAALESRLGVRVLLTRDGDQTVPLESRAALANNNKADLFISLHANASVRSSVTGAEVFYLSLEEYGDAPTDANAAPIEPLASFDGSERQIELILWEMAQLRHLEQSAVLAGIVERNLRQQVPMSARAIQQAPFRVLVGANMPAILVEMGFITNGAEEAKLTDAAHQQRIVAALVESVVGFRAHLQGAEGIAR